MRSRRFTRRTTPDPRAPRAGDTERLLRSGRVPEPRHEPEPEPGPSDDPVATADAVVEEAAEILATDLPTLPDERTREGLRQVGRSLSSAMSALAPYRTSADARLRAAYESVHDAITDLAAVYAWLTFGPGRAQRMQRVRDQRRADERE